MARRKKLKLRMDRIILVLLIFITIVCMIILGIYSLIKTLTREPKDDVKSQSSSVVSNEVTSQGNAFTPPKDTSAWELILANPSNNIGQDYAPPEIVTTNEGVEMDSRILEAYNKMAEDASNAGAPFWATSAYRSYQLQVDLFEKQVQQVLSEKPELTEEQAKQEAGTVVAVPGTSEHQTGLAIDVVSNEYTSLDENFETSKAFQWLQQNCYKYGFILRFPKGKEDITKIIYEPWHYRYVGVEAATEIMTKGITLEEYLGKVE